MLAKTLRSAPLLAVFALTSCDVLLDSMFESKQDRNIREDTRNQREGKPLEHYRTDRRLNLDREERRIDDLRSM